MARLVARSAAQVRREARLAARPEVRQVARLVPRRVARRVARLVVRLVARLAARLLEVRLEVSGWRRGQRLAARPGARGVSPGALHNLHPSWLIKSRLIASTSCEMRPKQIEHLFVCFVFRRRQPSLLGRCNVTVSCALSSRSGAPPFTKFTLRASALD